mmetsp:Transcript_20170/g.57256  ORF Transcript_20170/g.57256 Transcript_20170/m.57256 type:complete len:425 (-) Transcript_20170:58-1332(-)
MTKYGEHVPIVIATAEAVPEPIDGEHGPNVESVVPMQEEEAAVHGAVVTAEHIPEVLVDDDGGGGGGEDHHAHVEQYVDDSNGDDNDYDQCNAQREAIAALELAAETDAPESASAGEEPFESHNTHASPDHRDFSSRNDEGDIDEQELSTLPPLPSSFDQGPYPMRHSSFMISNNISFGGADGGPQCPSTIANVAIDECPQESSLEQQRQQQQQGQLQLQSDTLSSGRSGGFLSSHHPHAFEMEGMEQKRKQRRKVFIRVGSIVCIILIGLIITIIFTINETTGWDDVSPPTPAPTPYFEYTGDDDDDGIKGNGTWTIPPTSSPFQYDIVQGNKTAAWPRFDIPDGSTATFCFTDGSDDCRELCETKDIVGYLYFLNSISTGCVANCVCYYEMTACNRQDESIQDARGILRSRVPLPTESCDDE